MLEADFAQAVRMILLILLTVILFKQIRFFLKKNV